MDILPHLINDLRLYKNRYHRKEMQVGKVCVCEREKERERDGEGGAIGWVAGRERRYTERTEGRRDRDGERGRRREMGERGRNRKRQRQAVRMGRAEQTKEYKGRGLNEPRSQVSGYTRRHIRVLSTC